MTNRIPRFSDDNGAVAAARTALAVSNCQMLVRSPCGL